MIDVRRKFQGEAQVWCNAAGLPSMGSADGAAFNAHQRNDDVAVAAYNAAEEAATEATTAITVEAVFTPSLDALRHVMWCAAFVVFLQRHHASLLPANLKPKPDAMPWDEVRRLAEVAREET